MAGGRRKFPKTKSSKGKKWKKGESSSCNPETKTFRSAARNRFFQVNLGQKSELTAEALNKHNAELTLAKESETNEKPLSVVEDDASSVGGKTFDTFASNWTLCTNPCFERLLQKWHPNSAANKDKLAVLAAVMEVIKSKKGKETETEYFAALMSVLKDFEDEDLLTAAVSLLGIVMKKLPPQVMQVKFTQSSTLILELLSEHFNSERPSLIRGLIGCLSILLAVQDHGIWSNSTVLQTFNVVLSFITHSKPRIRHAAHHAVCRILTGNFMNLSIDSTSCHPCAALTAKFCVQQLEENGLSELTTTLHVLNFLKSALSAFPEESVKSCCESILGLMAAGNVLLTSCCMQALYGMFSGHPDKLNMSTELNGQLLTALYDFQPSPNDSQPMIAWQTIMKAALTNLLKLNEDLFLEHLAKFFSVITRCWLSIKIEVINAIASTLKALLYESARVLDEKVIVLLRSTPENALTPIHRICQTMESCMSFQYHSIWKQVLHVIAVFFEVFGKTCHTLMRNCIRSLSDLRKSVHFTYVNELDYALGKAVGSMGPKPVLDAVSLDLLNEEFEQSWLMPVLRDNIKETELKFFETYFLKLDFQCKKKMEDCEREGKFALAKSYKVLHYQIWSLLPGFCTSPTDLKTAFKDIAKTLGVALTEDSDVRLEVLSALRKLISSNFLNDDNREELGRFAKNFLPILFNIYTTPCSDSSDNGVRLSAFDTIQAYLRITNVELSKNLFDKAVIKVMAKEQQEFLRHAVLDIIRLLLMKVNYERIEKAFNICVENIKHRNQTTQKKAYKILEEICAGKTEDTEKLVQNSLTSLKTLITDLLSVTGFGSKVPRFRCLVHLLRHIPGDDREFVMSLIPEVISNITETPAKASSAAVNAIIAIGLKFLEWSEESRQEIMKKYLKIIYAGFGGSSHMVTSTAVALGHIISAFKGVISPDMLNECLEHISLLLVSKYRQLVGGALEFLRMFVVTYNDIHLTQYIDKIMGALNTMSKDSKLHFRMKLRRIFQRLVRKLGYDIIYKKAGSFEKLITYIRKQEALSKKKKFQSSQHEESEEGDTFSLKEKPQTIDKVLEDSDEESEGDAEARSASRKTGTKRNTAACIYEEADNEIVDLLDPKSLQNIFVSRPSLSTKSHTKEKDEFRVSEDGRLIIEERQENIKSTRKDASALYDEFTVNLPDVDYSTKRSKRKFDLAHSESGSTAGQSRGRKSVGKNTSKGSKSIAYGNKRPAKSTTGSQKLDPYAYLPLHPQALNKRKKVKFVGQFKGIVNSAKRGAHHGRKSKNKRMKTML